MSIVYVKTAMFGNSPMNGHIPTFGKTPFSLIGQVSMSPFVKAPMFANIAIWKDKSPIYLERQCSQFVNDAM